MLSQVIKEEIFYNFCFGESEEYATFIDPTLQILKTMVEHNYALNIAVFKYHPNMIKKERDKMLFKKIQTNAFVC